MLRTEGGGRSLRIERLSVRLAGEARPVLNGVDLEIDCGEAIGICGRSGTGKSTLLHAVAGLVPWLRPAEVSGDILLDGEVISDLDPGQRSRLLATCLDRPDAQLFLPTVEQEVEAAVRLHGNPASFDAGIRALGVGPLMGRRTTELSSGERQRVALVVTLGASPRSVLLDEPTAHLDENGATSLAALLVAINAGGGSVVVAEQAGWRLRDGITRWVEIDTPS
ncbi:MAG: ABC transporter ATP-binding protein [Acidobacteriota bacterium]